MGVGGDDGDKKNAAMLKHFRNLVDETASKARFLSTFQRVSTPSSDLDNMLDAAPSVKSEQLESKPSASAGHEASLLVDSNVEIADEGPAPAGDHEGTRKASTPAGDEANRTGTSVEPEQSEKTAHPAACVDVARTAGLPAARLETGLHPEPMDIDSTASSLLQAPVPEHESPSRAADVRQEPPKPSPSAATPEDPTPISINLGDKLSEPSRQPREKSAPATTTTSAAAAGRLPSGNSHGNPKMPRVLPLCVGDIKAEQAQRAQVGHGQMGGTHFREPVAADSSRAGAGGASPARPLGDDASLQQLLAVVGGAADEQLARQLLQQADGDVGRAINFFLDRPQAATAAAGPAAPAAAGTTAAPGAGVVWSLARVALDQQFANVQFRLGKPASRRILN